MSPAHRLWFPFHLAADCHTTSAVHLLGHNAHRRQAIDRAQPFKGWELADYAFGLSRLIEHSGRGQGELLAVL